VGRVHGATLSQAHAQRKTVERVTGLEVEPLIAYSRAWVDKPMARRKGVRVLPARMLLGYLAKRPQRLSEQDVEQAQERLARALFDERARSRTREYRHLIG
jgi:hypothetical protein